MTFATGDFVRHPGQPAWGTGRVLEMISPGKVKVRFASAGEKVLLLSFAPLELTSPSPPEERALAGPEPRIKRQAAVTTRPHEKLVAEFLWVFPEGFRGSAYAVKERDAKLKAHELATWELSETRLEAAIASGRFEDVVNAALEVMGATNLVSPSEKAALRDALAKQEAREKFSVLLVDLLHGTRPFQALFEAFADFLVAAKVASWPTATYFPFILHPKEHMFLEPGVTQRAAAAYGFKLDYEARVNWRTYEQLLAFSRKLEKSLAPLQPADMLDIQSFVAVVGTGD
jgi:hypothetical protein